MHANLSSGVNDVLLKSMIGFKDFRTVLFWFFYLFTCLSATVIKTDLKEKDNSHVCCLVLNFLNFFLKFILIFSEIKMIMYFTIKLIQATY
jgi:hypothetical protein